MNIGNRTGEPQTKISRKKYDKYPIEVKESGIVHTVVGEAKIVKGAD